jgi:hypothetical protein
LPVFAIRFIGTNSIINGYSIDFSGTGGVDKEEANKAVTQPASGNCHRRAKVGLNFVNNESFRCECFRFIRFDMRCEKVMAKKNAMAKPSGITEELCRDYLYRKCRYLHGGCRLMHSR